MTIEDDPKLEQLQKDLKVARDEYEQDYNPKPVQNIQSEGASIGYEFLAYVISGGLLGYGIDYFFHTLPFGLMICMILGLVLGVFRANYRTQKAAKK